MPALFHVLYCAIFPVLSMHTSCWTPLLSYATGHATLLPAQSPFLPVCVHVLQAGAVRALLAEAAAAAHPLVHAQRSLGAGAAAAGLFALGGLLEQEQQRMDAAAERRREWEEGQ